MIKALEKIYKLCERWCWLHTVKHTNEQEKKMLYLLQRLFCIQRDQEQDYNYSQTEIGEGYALEDSES